jgi:MFS family permease
MKPAPHNIEDLENRRGFRRNWLRGTLKLSQREAVASSTMTATSDNFFNAFAIFLHASMTQMGWLTGLPQLFGALTQFISVWLSSFFCRKKIIVAGAVLQACGLFLMALLAAIAPHNSVWLFIFLAMLYHGLLNLIQPQWRAWMGSIVPSRRRGTFFASRTRITMFASLCVFFAGGGMLSLTDSWDMAWLGFSILFLVASIGRFVSARLLWLMHDPQPRQDARPLRQTLHQLVKAWRDPVFRQYSLFVAGMQAMVAISAPFFAVYMLNELNFTYLQFVLASVASIATQFATLRFWGRFSDSFGNRLVMIITSIIIPFTPILWLFSGDMAYILIIQAISGLAWSGFTLSTANYLYDIRPHHSDFATYAATQAGLSAALVFVGALLGGGIATMAEGFLQGQGPDYWLGSPIFVVFVASAMGRIAVTAWFIPRSVEPNLRPRPKMLSLVLRVSRFNAISGVSLDWLTVTKKPSQKQKDEP